MPPLTRKEASRLARRLRSADDMRALLPCCRPLSWFGPGRTVKVADRMTRRSSYVLTAPAGRLGPDFRPQLSPARILRMGAFEGKYLNDCMMEFPREWYRGALRAGKLCPQGPDPHVNAFGKKSRLSLKKWRQNGWIVGPDPRGWFQWYCRYWLGRRTPYDEHQIARWRAIARHRAQILAHPPARGVNLHEHRPRQRQTLLQWAYNPYV